jgi:hypothetical protein
MKNIQKECQARFDNYALAIANHEASKLGDTAGIKLKKLLKIKNKKGV